MIVLSTVYDSYYESFVHNILYTQYAIYITLDYFDVSSIYNRFFD